MLVNAADMLKKAEAGKYGLGAFNTNNLEWTLAILQAAEEAKSPLILQCTAGAAKWMGGFKVCADMVKAAVEATGVTVPVALHLDHGSYEDCFKCIEAGFTSIMYDGSHEETFQLNLDRTKELVELAHSVKVGVPARNVLRVGYGHSVGRFYGYDEVCGGDVYFRIFMTVGSAYPADSILGAVYLSAV